jgi:hypothetical protein
MTACARVTLGANGAEGKGGAKLNRLNESNKFNEGLMPDMGCVLTQQQIFILGKLSEFVKISIRALFKLFVCLISTVPGSIQVIVKMTHFNPKLSDAVIRIGGEVFNGLIKLLGGLS